MAGKPETDIDFFVISIRQHNYDALGSLLEGTHNPTDANQGCLAQCHISKNGNSLIGFILLVVDYLVFGEVFGLEIQVLLD